MSWYLPDDAVIPDFYATPADYLAWPGTGDEAPANILGILRSCSALVADATEGDWYDVDPATGLPTSTRTVNAFRDATCIQALAWVTLGIDPAAGGVQQLAAGASTSRKIGSASITRSEAEIAAVAAAQAAARTGLVSDAVMLLRRNGLGGSAIWTLG